jgi:glutamate formiminotransferase
MTAPLVECVPNFSEGRDLATVDAITAAIASAGGVMVLDRHADPDHNRSVITFAGPPAAVGQAAVRAVERAVERIDLNRHRGVHPRIGSADVVPFVPIRDASLADCVALAESVGREIWERLGVPVYLYEAAARRPERARLEVIRRGQFEGLRREVRTNPDRWPDIGGPELHPTAGATVVGARKFLVAYNLILRTADAAIARRIARAVRASSGGLPCVKAIGLYLPSRGVAQVSMNLTDFEQTPPQRVFEAVRAEAARLGVELGPGELIGLVPRAALAAGDEWFQQLANRDADPVLEQRLGL